MTSRVGHVSLRIRTVAAEPAVLDAVRHRIEHELIIEILETVEWSIAARMGPRAIVRLRSLPVCWQLGLDELGHSDLGQRLGTELAMAVLALVEASSASAPPRPPADASVVVFDDEAHEIAVYLDHAVRGGEVAWYHAHHRDAVTCWQALLELGANAIVTVMARLDAMGALDQVLGAAPPEARARLAALHVVGLPPAARRAWDVHREGWRSGSPATPVASSQAAAPGQPRASSNIGQEAPPSTDAPAPSQSSTQARPQCAAPTPRAAIEDESLIQPMTAAAPQVTSLAVENFEKPTPDVLETVLPAKVEGSEIVTQAAGLFYLVGRVLELDLAEHLWQVGLPEGPWLAEIASAVGMTSRDDPAWRWFGGCFEAVPELALPPAWAVEELASRCTHALGMRLARVGLVTTREHLERELDRLVSERTLPRLDPTTAAVVGRAAACLTMLVSAHLGEPPAATRMPAVAGIPGTLRLGQEALHVAIDARHIDIEIRLTGLDADPGWAPWLGRYVRIEFRGLESM